MKIYPGNQKIYNVSEIDSDRDISLGYLDSEFLEETIIINLDDEMTIDQSKEMLPYDSIDSLEKTFYDKNGIAISKEEQENMFKRQSTGTYIYTPKSSTIFEPLNFSYKVLAKKNMKYVTSRKYNLRAACVNTSDAEKMIQFFSDSYDRKICPTNIKFNNGDRKIDSLISASLEELDFLFINYSDVVTEDDSRIDINELIKANIVPWVSCSRIPGEDYIDFASQKEITFDFKTPEVTNTGTYSTKEYFNVPRVVTHEIDEVSYPVIYHNIFKYYTDKSPIIIKEIVGKGFVVYASYEFMNNLDKYSDIFYEVMMYVYFRTYVSTQEITSWIANEMPNYVVQNGRLTQKDKFTSHMELYKLLNLKEGDATPINIEMLGRRVANYVGMSSDYLVFKKIEQPDTTDPVRGPNQLSIFTEKKNIMFFDEFIYSIKEQMSDKITCIVDEDKLVVTVNTFKNTNLDTGNYKTSTVSFKLDDTLMSQGVNLVWNKNLKTIELVSNLTSNEVLIANIQVIKEKKGSKLYDMRQRGGGLPEGKSDNFNLLDIGNILGRPYRKGGTLITTINVPKKYSYNKDAIYEAAYNALKDNMVAEDYLVLNIEFI